VLQCVAVCCSVLQCVAVCCSVLQCVAVCCSVLQCVAVCCSKTSLIKVHERCFSKSDRLRIFQKVSSLLDVIREIFMELTFEKKYKRYFSKVSSTVILHSIFSRELMFREGVLRVDIFALPLINVDKSTRTYISLSSCQCA